MTLADLVLAAPPSPPRTFVTSTGVRFELHEFGEGHERVFAGAWTWRDAVAWSEDEIARKVRLGLWRRVASKEARR